MAKRITFPDRKTFERAVNLFYEDDMLKDLDINTDDGGTLLVPPCALPRLRELEVSFEEV